MEQREISGWVEWLEFAMLVLASADEKNRV
jgi:hypothetical protein